MRPVPRDGNVEKGGKVAKRRKLFSLRRYTWWTTNRYALLLDLINTETENYCETKRKEIVGKNIFSMCILSLYPKINVKVSEKSYRSIYIASKRATNCLTLIQNLSQQLFHFEEQVSMNMITPSESLMTRGFSNINIIYY